MERVTTLRDETKELFLTRPANLSKKTIAENVGVSVRWLERFASGDIENPGVVTVETLKDYLSKVHNNKLVKNV